MCRYRCVSKAQKVVSLSVFWNLRLMTKSAKIAALSYAESESVCLQGPQVDDDAERMEDRPIASLNSHSLSRVTLKRQSHTQSRSNHIHGPIRTTSSLLQQSVRLTGSTQGLFTPPEIARNPDFTSFTAAQDGQNGPERSFSPTATFL